MTTIMTRVTCSICGEKMDESKWKEHLVSTEHLENCRNQKEGLLMKFFELIFNTYLNRSDIYDLKNEKVFEFWEMYFETKQPKEKFDKLCSDSDDESELEASLVADLLEFKNNCSYDIGSSYLDSLDKITVCRICNTEVHNSLLYDHINSKEHRDTEEYFIRKCMTYCDHCHIEIRNDAWREHILTFNHSHHTGQKYCDICKMKYTVVINGTYSYEIEKKHLESDNHKKKLERLGFYSC